MDFEGKFSALLSVEQLEQDYNLLFTCYKDLNLEFQYDGEYPVPLHFPCYTLFMNRIQIRCHDNSLSPHTNPPPPPIPNAPPWAMYAVDSSPSPVVQIPSA